MAQDVEMNTASPQAGPGEADPLQRERDDLHERLLRTTADFENYRKRIERERRELAEFAAADLIRDVLPVLDDFERALAVGGGPSDDATRRGIELIHRRLLEVLRKRGVEPFDVIGQDFNPEWHEAVGSEPANGRREGEITAELRRGYRLGGRLLRAPMVRVAKS